MLLTTSVGSFPKPDYLVKARSDFRRGRITREELFQLELKATEEVIRLQERLGLDILVDGEMYRGDMTTYFAENMGGFEISGIVRSHDVFYYRKPVIVSAVTRPEPVTVGWFQRAQGLTSKLVKGMFTGPYTMMDWSFNEHYPTRRDACLALADAFHDEAADLERAGARYIQIDEPAISTRPAEIGLAIEAMEIVVKGLSAKTICHICYGHFDSIYPRLLELPVDQLDLEFANRGFHLLDVMKSRPFDKEIAFGVLDVHSDRIETKAEIKEALRRALQFFPPEKLYVDPDCGLKTRTPRQAEAKLANMVAAVREVKEELGLS